jgi:hypothetical protein
MTAADFRRIALSLEGVEEYSHAGLPAFRVGGRKFASLASQAGGYGNLMLTLEQQAAFVEEAPEIFLPIPGGWGKMGHTSDSPQRDPRTMTGAPSLGIISHVCLSPTRYRYGFRSGQRGRFSASTSPAWRTRDKSLRHVLEIGTMKPILLIKQQSPPAPAGSCLWSLRSTWRRPLS